MEVYSEVKSLLAKRDAEVALIESQFQTKKIREAVEWAFDWRLERAHKWRDSKFKAYSDAAAKGTPFKEREALIDKKTVAMIDRGIWWTENMRKKYKLRPVDEWLQHGDYDYLKKVGLREFAKWYLTDMIDTPIAYPEPKKV